MTHEVRAVVARQKGTPVSVETVLVPDPGPGEALVRVQACGVCHTDLHYREGGISDEFPFLLGHEAAGVVEAVGEGVTDVAPGDFVVLNWRAVCGRCRACLFSGDTLFQDGPGATGRSFSDFDTIISSIHERLLKPPADTTVHTGHGDTTSIGAEAPHLDPEMARIRC